MPLLPIIGILFWLHGLMVSKFWCVFSKWEDTDSWHVFLNNYHMSGFDPYFYNILTEWGYAYDVIRHPLLAWMLLPLSMVNKLLIDCTGTNCAPLFVAAILAFCAFYAYLFLYRILHDNLHISSLAAMTISLIFFGFAHITVACIVADHFCISLFLILLTLHLAAEHLQDGSRFSLRESLALFVTTAGVTLSNGIIVLIAVMVVNGRDFFRPRFLLSTAIIPSLLLLAIGVGINATRFSIYSTMVNPVESQMRDVQETVPFFGEGDTRFEVLCENFFGESLQLHRKHILGDVLVNRPLIVEYSWWEQYVVEALLVLMMLGGIWFARKERLMLILSLILGFNIALHIVLGFAVNEVHIMACHWAFILPIAYAYLYKETRQHVICRTALLIILISISVYLYAYHGTLLFNYLTWPLKF